MKVSFVLPVSEPFFISALIEEVSGGGLAQRVDPVEFYVCFLRSEQRLFDVVEEVSGDCREYLVCKRSGERFVEVLTQVFCEVVFLSFLEHSELLTYYLRSLVEWKCNSRIFFHNCLS